MADAVSSDEPPRASTSKEGADPRVSESMSATYRGSLVTENLPVMNAADLRRDITGPNLGSSGDTSNILGSATSSLAKLQTYLPTGTWMMYTALQTWALSLRPGDPPASATSTCNAHQRIALIIVIGLSTLLSFLSCFVKRFVYDAAHVHVLYPAPDLFNVTRPFTDLVTNVKFPCRTKEKRYCWPLINDAGELRYDEKDRLRVMVFKLGIKIHVRRKLWCKRVWRSWFHPEDPVEKAPPLSTSSSHTRNTSLASNFPRSEAQDVTIDIDDILTTTPTLQPRWTRTIVGAEGSQAYLDMRLCVWAHAIVSVLSFFTLALFSTQVCGCLYPAIPDYLPPTLQTAMLILLGLIAALFIKDDAVSLGQTVPQNVQVSPHGEADNVPVSLGQTAPQNVQVSTHGQADKVPEHLRELVDTLVWIRRRDG